MRHAFDQHDPSLPGPDDLPGLARDLGRISRTQTAIPPAIDEAIRAALRAPRGSAGRPWRRAVAIAATIVVATSVVGLAVLTQPHGSTHAADLDRNGVVDVLDAALLDRLVRAGNVVPDVHDLDGDGLVDARDVDVVATLAVSIDGRSS